MKRFKYRHIILYSIFLWTCEDKAASSSLDSIQIVTSQDVLMPKQTTFLYARGFDKNGNRLNRLSINWMSLNESIATIDSEGKVLAISKGVATISATSSNISGMIEIIISENKKRVLSEMFTSST